MAYPFTVSKRTRQPQGIARVDPGYRYARNLRGAWLSSVGAPLQNASGIDGIGALTAVGGCSFVSTPYGLGVSLNGSSQYLVNTANTKVTNLPCTFFLFFKTAITSTQRVFDISTGTTAEDVLGVQIASGGEVRAQHYDGGVEAFAYENITTGTWYSVAGRFNGTASRDIFVNGTLVRNNSNVVSPVSGTVDRVTLGYAWWSGAEYFNGTIASPLLFDTAISDAEIAELHNNPLRWLAPSRRIWVQLGAANETIDTAAGAVVTATASAIAGALTAASAATAATVAASASAIAGAATSSSQAAAATVTATASAISGAATGAGQSAAATVAATASATGGAATAASATTAATITASSSAIAGAASGTAAATATGATVVADASIIAGSATGNAAGTATGATVAADASAIAGSSSASAAATGQTAAVTASATAGSAQSDHAAAGAVVSASTTAIPGAIAVGAGATTLGATVAATVTYQSGAVAAASSAAGWTQVVTAIAARGVAYGALPDIDPRYLVPSRKRRFTVQARGRRFNART